MLKLRIATALVLASTALWAIYGWSALGFGAFLLVITYSCAWEWSALLGIENISSRLVLAMSLCFVTAAFLIFDSLSLLRALVLVAVIFWIAMLIDMILRPVVPKAKSVRWGLLAFAAPVLVISVVSIFWVRQVHSAHAIVFIVALVALADIGAYFSGKAVGKRKLAELISSGKTVEGAIGGVVLAMMLAVVVIFFFPFTGMAKSGLLFFSLVAVLFSIVGDLYISRAKRTQGVKDSGNLLPGHGGVLDRFDGLLAAVPWMAFALFWL